MTNRRAETMAHSGFPKDGTLPFPLLFPSLPSEVGPLMQLGDMVERCKLPTVCGRSPAAERYLLHWLKKASDESNFMCIFTEKYL